MSGKPRTWSSPGTYLAVLIAGLSIVLGSFAALNVAMDPFGIYRGVDRASLPVESLTSRITVAERLRQLPYDTLLVGSSRVAVFSEQSAELSGRPTLNMSMPGAAMEEMLRVVEYACKIDSPRRIVLCADFFQFSELRLPAPEFHRSRLAPELSWFEFHCDKLIGRHAVKESWKGLRNELLAIKWSTAPADTTPVAATIAPPTTRATPPGKLRRQSFEADMSNYLSPNGFYGGFKYSDARVDQFRLLVRCAVDNDVELIVVILPVHALELETVRAAGLWNDFERWKCELTEVCRSEAADGRAATIPVWDFTGYTLQRAEPVPSAESMQDMQWYVNASHFTSNFSGLILQRIFRDAERDDELAVRLDRVDVQRHLAAVRQDRTQWVAANGAEAENVQRIARRVGRRLPEQATDPAVVAAEAAPLPLMLLPAIASVQGSNGGLTPMPRHASSRTVAVTAAVT